MDDNVAPTIPDGRSMSRHRGPDGLMDKQRRYFELLSELGDKPAVCAALGIKIGLVTRWLRNDDAFLKAHEQFFAGSHDATKARFQEMQEMLPDLAQELMESHKIITVQHVCTECGHKDTVEVNTTNDTVRARMWEAFMKASGHLADVRRIEGNVSVTHLTAGQRIALEKLRRGLIVSVQQRKELESMGLLEGLKKYDGGNIIEAEIVDEAKGV